MRKILIHLTALFFSFSSFNLFAQDKETFDETGNEVEVYLIDNYVKNEQGKILILSWMTSIPVKSKAIIEEIGTFVVCDTLTDFHHTKIDLSNYRITKEEIGFKVISELEDGTVIESDEYTFRFPIEEIAIEDSGKKMPVSSSYYIYNLALGVTLWLLPSPALAFENNQTKFALLKELPIISIGSASAYKTFPYCYLYAGYLHIFDGQVKNSFRSGIKYLYELNSIKHFVSVGIGGFSNFKGDNGISGEIGFSFLKILGTFEMFASYSYNYIPSAKHNFHLLSIGLFTSSFSINLNY